MSVKKRLNPNAYATSIMQFHKSEAGCDCKSDPVVKYDADLDFTEEKTAIVVKIDGVDTTLPLVGNPVTKKETRVAIADALATKGYDAYFSLDNLIGISVSGNTLAVIGEAVMVSITQDGTAVPFVAKPNPTRITVTRFTNAGGAAVDVTVNGGNAVDAGDPAAVTAEADTKTAFETAGAVVTRVSINLVAGVYVVDVHSTSDSDELTYGGVEGNTAEVYRDFIAD